MKMKKALFILFSIGVLFLVGCAGFRQPQVNAGYYIDVKPDSKATLQIGTNNSQANSIHSPIGSAEGGEGETADATKQADMAKSSGLFVNNNVGDRSADVDTTAALELLRNVKGASAGQAQTTSKGDSSPTTSGDQSQTPTSADTKTTTIPVAVGQTAPKAEAKPETQSQPQQQSQQDQSNQP
jgi:hypothetical protein